MKPLREFVPENKRFVVAHRGSSGTAPENTLAAISEAIEAGAKMVEIDVRLTADDYVVLLHDHVLGRTTSGHGKSKELLYTDIKDLDAGGWFNEKFSNERVPLLEQALQLLRKHECYVNIEIKPPQPNENFEKRIERIVDIVDECKMLPNTLFGSFHHHSLKVLKQQYPSAHTAAINLPGDNRLPSEIAHEIQCEALVCSLRECTHKRTNDAHAHGLYMGVYTINTEQDLQHILKYDVTAIVSNYPKQIIDLLNLSR
ncbi:MAG: hypothetical protein JNJ85_05575 [Candidatus Kapabacteria bacterium]|nr:hypothetical protein [Candidatus Kapabacteria bacterium]